MPDDTTAVKRTPAQTATAVVGWALAAVLTAVQGWGYLTPEQSGRIQAVVSHHEEVVSADTSEQPVKGMTPEQQDALLQVLKDLADRWQPKPAPPKPPVPAPKPEPPAIVVVDPEPTKPLPPVVKPSQAIKIVLTDETGKPVTLNEAQPGQLLLVTASDKSPVAWSVAKHGDVRLLVLPDNAGYAVSLQVGSDVQFFLTDASLKSTTVLVVCGPRPPPVIVPPVIVPPVVTPTPVPVPVTPVPLVNDPTGLSKVSHDGKLLVNSPQRVQQAQKIAKAHRDAATNFLNNTDPFSLVSVMEKETTAAIKASLTPAEITLWIPWSAPVAERMTELQESGEITTREEWAAAYTAIAAGLEVEP